MLFTVGQLLITPAAEKFVRENDIDILSVLARHLRGDWGDLDDEDDAANKRAIGNGGRLLSSYNFPQGKIWIITAAEDDEGKRESTCIMLPSDY